MSGGWPQEIVGRSTRERAVSLAGLLAEAGVKRVELVWAGGSEEVWARKTDLPGRIEALLAEKMTAAAAGAVEALPHGGWCEVCAGEVKYRADAKRITRME